MIRRWAPAHGGLFPKNFYDGLGYATIRGNVIIVENDETLHYYEMEKTIR